MAWHKAITHRQAARLERVQRVALKVIYGQLKPYRSILADNKIQTLKQRRAAQCLVFAKKALKHKKFKQWFKAMDTPEGSRTKFAQPQARCKRFLNSPISFMTELLNENNSSRAPPQLHKDPGTGHGPWMGHRPELV